MEVKEKNPNRIIKLCVIIGLLLITLVMGVYMINVAYHKIDNPNGVCVFYITLYCIWIVVCIVGVCQHSGDVWYKVEDFF